MSQWSKKQQLIAAERLLMECQKLLPAAETVYPISSPEIQRAIKLFFKGKASTWWVM